MLIPTVALQLISVIYALLALFGAYLAAYNVYVTGERIDKRLLKARVFLSESFLKDTWTLLLLACLLFLVHAIMELNQVFSLFIEESVADLIAELVEVGIILCIILSSYKWFRLTSLEGNYEQAEEMEKNPDKK
ncbi:MAG: hypothetical protein FIB08_01820 [Candidatus Methanoperedens sp.]|nr:hypothetical protein [Candidatus Methanoperedens sp.]